MNQHNQDSTNTSESEAREARGAPLPANEARRMAALSRYRILDTLPEEDFDRMTRLAADICHAPIAAISLVAECRQWAKAHVGPIPQELPRDQSLCAYAILDPDEIMVVPDTLQDARFRDLDAITGPPGIRFYAGAPLTVGDGISLGTLCVMDTTPRQLSREQLSALNTLRHSIVSQLELRRQTVEATTRNSIFFEILHALNRAHNPDPVLRATVEAMMQSGLWHSIGISLPSADGRYWRTHAENRMQPDELGEWHSLQAGVIGRAYRSGAIQYVADTRNDSEFFLADDETQILSELAIPIRFEDQVLGVMNLESVKLDAFSDQDIAFASAIADALAVALKNMQRFTSLQREITFIQTLIQSSSIFFVALRPDYTILMMNQFMLDTLGYRPEEVEHQSYLDLFVPQAEQAAVKRIFHRIAVTHQVTISENSIIGKDGRKYLIEWHGKPVLQDNVLDYFFGIGVDVTARSRMEQAMRESNTRFHQIANAINEVFWMYDDRMRVMTYVSPAFETIYGRTVESYYQNPHQFLDAIHPDDRAAVQASFDRQGFGERTELEFRVVRPDGNIRWVFDRTFPIRDDDGRVTKVIGITADITERKLAAIALRESEEKYLALLASLDSVIVSVDRDGRFLYLNEMAAEQYGAPVESMIGKLMTDLFPPEVAERQLANVRTVIDEGRPLVNEALSIVRGQPRWYRNSLQPIHDGMGQVAYVLINATDIHDIKSAQQELEQLNRTLEQRVQERTTTIVEGEAHNRLLFEESPEAMVLIDAQARILRVNRAFKTLTGRSEEQLVGRVAAETALLPPDMLNSLISRAGHDFAAGHDVATLEFAVDDSDRPMRYMIVRIFPLAIDGQQHFLASISDITTRKQTEETLRRANAELERAMRMKDEFLANMSHELRTPLHGILALSESLLEQFRGPLNDYQQKSLHAIESSGQHLLMLINDLLDISKIESGNPELQIERFQIDEICQASMVFVRQMAHKKQIQLSYKNAAPHLVMRADPRRMKQMLTNLLSNAVKFTNEGGRVTLDITVDVGAQTIHFAVQDTGIGITTADQGRLFQPFVQLDARLSRQFEGTGLGLALVKQLAALHGGKVVVASSGIPGEGSCFTIILPLEPNEISA